jgi:nucleotide-binding universal stress UspA family protein
MIGTSRDAGTVDLTLEASGGGLLVAAFEPEGALAALRYVATRPDARCSHVRVVTGVRRPRWWPLVLASPGPSSMLAERGLLEAAHAEVTAAGRELGLRPCVHVVSVAQRLEPAVARTLAERDFCLVAIGARRRDRRAQRLLDRATAWCAAELVPAS